MNRPDDLGGNLNIVDNPQLGDLDGLCGLGTAGGLFVVSNDALTNLGGLGAPTAVSQTLTVSGKSLTSVSGLSALASVRLLNVNLGNPTAPGFLAMDTFGLPALQSAENVEIHGRGGSLRTVSLPQLTSLTGDLSVQQTNGGAVHAPLLAGMDDLTVSSQPADLTVTLAPGVNVRNDLRIESNTSGTALTMAVDRVGNDVRVTGNVSLSLDAVSVGSVGRDLRFGECGGAGNHDTELIPQVGPVGQDIRIHGNVGFSDAEATAYVNSITVGRQRRVSDHVESSDTDPC